MHTLLCLEFVLECLPQAIRQSSEASKALKSIKQRVATARFEQEERSSFLEQQALVCDVDESRGDAFITEIENVKVQMYVAVIVAIFLLQFLEHYPVLD